MARPLNNEEYHLLLTVIDNEGDLDDLLGLDFDYESIIALINTEILKGNVVFIDNQIKLTDSGKTLKSKLFSFLDYDDSVILPKVSSKLKQSFNKEDVFVPDIGEIDF